MAINMALSIAIEVNGRTVNTPLNSLDWGNTKPDMKLGEDPGWGPRVKGPLPLPPFSPIVAEIIVVLGFLIFII